MSPLRRYYVALAAWFLTLPIGHSILFSVPDSMRVVFPIEFAVFFALFFYVMFIIRCPKCRKRLSQRLTWFARGFPGRFCPKCDYDLSTRQISNGGS